VLEGFIKVLSDFDECLLRIESVTGTNRLDFEQS